ncbi:hypothetical protein [Hydrogenophaga sp.]|uniref:hypothetical protein n=1 Tax=Hydrogenophaga sp. TaxID=1904254 RepID=UPI0025BBDA6C|nr:hypothetical protein [Hydrogenophaga sp.]
MDEWWSYRPSDLLMFSPAIYWRLFESLNRQAWALPLGLAIVALVVSWRSARGTDRGRISSARAMVSLLALGWLGVAWAFFWQQFAPIYTAAPAFAWLFVAQGLGLMVLAFAPGLRWATGHSARHIAGLLLAAWALVGHPALAGLSGRPWVQAEWLALAPDPTALATLALLLLLDGSRHRFTRAWQRVLWVPPMLWCAATSLTLWTLGEAQAWVVAVLAALALLAATGRSPDRG